VAAPEARELALEHLSPHTHHLNMRVRCCAATVVGVLGCGEARAQAVGCLVSILEQPDRDLQLAAVRALRGVGVEMGDVAVVALVAVLEQRLRPPNDQEEEAQQQLKLLWMEACSALERAGERAIKPEVIRALAQFLRGADRNVDFVASKTLWKFRKHCMRARRPLRLPAEQPPPHEAQPPKGILACIVCRVLEWV
jgi:hypothetical protein